MVSNVFEILLQNQFLDTKQKSPNLLTTFMNLFGPKNSLAWNSQNNMSYFSNTTLRNGQQPKSTGIC